MLYLGGPVFCKDPLSSNYTFGRNVKPLVNLTVCGVPAPNVTWSFCDEGGITRRKPVENFTYEYSIQLEELTQKTCGMELVLNVTGYSSIKEKLQLFVDRCKYWDCSVYLENSLNFRLVKLIP